MKSQLGIFFATLSLFSFSHAEEQMAPDLHTDPFISPLEQPLVETEVVAEKSDVETSTNKTEPRETFLWQPELRGIIHSDDISIVNIGGDMVEMGMEYEGYRLIKIKGQSVVFEKNGRQVYVSMDETE